MEFLKLVNTIKFGTVKIANLLNFVENITYLKG